MQLSAIILLCAFLFSARITYFNCDTLPDDSVLTIPWNAESVSELKQQYKIIYPALVTGGRKACRLEKCLYAFRVEHRRFVLFVQQNQMLLSQNGQYKAVIDSVTNVYPIWKGQCYYQGIVVKHPSSSVSLSTCHGLRGSVILENNTYLIVPLNPRNSTSYPHAFVSLPMGSETRDGKVKPYYLQEPYLNPMVATQIRFNNYVELSLIIDKDMAKQMKLNLEELFNFYFDVVNTLDLLLQQIHVRMSIVHAELWVNENLIDIADDASGTLDILAQILADRVDRNSADITLVLSASGANESQLAVFTNSLCTTNATGLVRIPEKLHPFFISQMMMRAIGHILGVLLDNNDMKRERKYDDKIMESGYKIGELTERTYMQIYQNTHTLRQNVLALASKDEGQCLLNLPLQRSDRAKCGNRFVDEGEECDCGTEEVSAVLQFNVLMHHRNCRSQYLIKNECERVDPCCVPLKCQLRQGAQCSTGPCCDSCMFSSEKKVCRPSQDEYCDFSEYCSGTSSMCPADSYKQDSTSCGSFGEGYCYMGKCQSASDQCREILGSDYSMANETCFRRMNMMGTVFGHCGIDAQGNPVACSSKDYLCGILFCQRNATSLKSKEFSRYRILGQEVIECSISADVFPWRASLVKDGTKCGANMMCYAHSCIPITQFQRNSSCPTNNVALICSGHGSCTNLNKCLCDAGWASHDCSFKMAVNKISAQYFSVKKGGSGEWVFLNHKNEEKCLVLSNGTLSIAACCIGIITCVAVLFYLILNRRFKFCYSPRKVELQRVKNEMPDVILMRAAAAADKNYIPIKASWSQDDSIVEAKAYSSADGSAVTAGKRSVNRPASDVCRGMHKWTAPKLYRNNSWSSWIRKSDCPKELFSNDHGRNSVCSISRCTELTQKHFQFLVDLHDDGIFFDEVKSTVKGMPKNNAARLSGVCSCLSKPFCGTDSSCCYLRGQHLSASRSMLSGYESTALLCTNPSTVCNKYSDMLSTSCQRPTELISATRVCSSDKQEFVVSTSQRNEYTPVNGEGRPVSVFLDDVIFGQQKLT